MAYNYLYLVNRVLRAFGEVPLTGTTFSGATGFHAYVKDNINVAIFDIFTEQDAEWPWTWQQFIKDTSVGIQSYAPDTTYDKLDWDSFRVEKPEVSVTSLTQSLGTATATTASSHYLVVGDKVTIRGANQTEYNTEFTVVSTPSTTEFTFNIPASVVSPATGAIYCYPPFSEEYLPLVNYDVYRKKYLENDRNTINPESFGKPDLVVRLLDNKFLLSPRPDRVYPIRYEGFYIPNALDAYSDIPIIPEEYHAMIVDRALYYAYMFRDNYEQATMADKRYKDTVRKNRRVLIDQPAYMAHD